MAWERFRNRRRGAARTFPVKFEGRFQTEMASGSPIYILYLHNGLAREVGRKAALWFDPARSALGLSAAHPGDLDAFRIGPTTSNISLSGIARKYALHHVFDGRVVPCEIEGDKYVFSLRVMT